MMALSRPNKIYFHFSNKKINYFFFHFLLILTFSTINSIDICKIIKCSNLFNLVYTFRVKSFFYFQKKPEAFQKIIKIFIISTIFNVIIIFLYNLVNYETYKTFTNILRFKGVLNIITILVLILTFFQNKRYLYLPIFFLIPSLILSNSNAPVLGILSGLFFYMIFFFTNKIRFLKKTIIFSLVTIFTLISFKNVNNLPTEFDPQSIKNFEFKIPTKLIDTHRQFIWGFSLNKFKSNPLLGYGPDTSNFINESQRIIGHKTTGDMTFIPSHPHNFFIEILLEIGILGTFSFILFILFINYQILKMQIIEKNFFLFFLMVTSGVLLL